MEKDFPSNILAEIHENASSWLVDTLSCVEKIPSTTFSLSEMYSFEDELYAKHPDNNNIRAKLRQQLQILRDEGVIEFLNPGEYKKLF